MIAVITYRKTYERVDSAYLDCFSDNLAVLLCQLGISDVRTPFACQWHFAFDPLENDGLPTLLRTPVEEMIRHQTGCVTQRLHFAEGKYREACEDFINQNTPVLIFGDAYFMPWLPYFAHEHMQHSFIVDGVSADKRALHIVDAYANQTAWGNAQPIDTYLPTSALEPIVQALNTPDAGSFLIMQHKERAQEVNIPALLLRNAEDILFQAQENAALSHFSTYYAQNLSAIEALKQFTLACWLVARSRMLHQLWLVDVARKYPDVLDQAFPELFLQAVSQPWQRVSEFAYILLRRVSQGKRPPLTCFQLLEQTLSPNEIRVAMVLKQQLVTRNVVEV